MNEKPSLLIVFVKNIKLGKVKTRLAKTIGDDAAFEVYKKLVSITEKASTDIDIEKRIYFSQSIVESQWEGLSKHVQHGADLGERMKNAFQQAFSDGYSKVILIGSDLPDMNADVLKDAFSELENKDVVIGPAEDGGYYLVGMQKEDFYIFDDMPWRQSDLLLETKAKLDKNRANYAMLTTMNDIDTEEDLRASSFYGFLTRGLINLTL